MSYTEAEVNEIKAELSESNRKLAQIKDFFATMEGKVRADGKKPSIREILASGNKLRELVRSI
jgi:hypothetical protein